MDSSAGTCNSRFCPVNTQPSGNVTTKRQNNSGVVVINRNPNPNVIQKPVAVDPNQNDRNRQLRMMIEANEARRYQEQAMARKYQIENDDRMFMAKGNQEASKLRLVITLQKLQGMGVTYSYVSDYFSNCFKGLTNMSGDMAIISSILIFDKQDLVNSDQCYTTAINAVGKTTTTNFGVIYDAIESLSQVVTDFKV